MIIKYSVPTCLPDRQAALHKSFFTICYQYFVPTARFTPLAIQIFVRLISPHAQRSPLSAKCSFYFLQSIDSN